MGQQGYRAAHQLAEAVEEGLAVILPAGGGGFGVFAQVKFHADLDAEGDEPTHGPLADGHHQYDTDGKAVDQIPQNDEPDGTLRMIGDEGTVRDPKDHPGNQQDHLETDELDHHGRAADADGRTVFAEGVNLQRLSAGSAGGHITIVDSRNGGVDALPQFDGVTLLLQIEVDGQCIGKDVQHPAK